MTQDDQDAALAHQQELEQQEWLETNKELDNETDL